MNEKNNEKQNDRGNVDAAHVRQQGADRTQRRLVAHELGLAPRQIEITAGEGARIKRLRIGGDPQTLDAALDRLTKGSA